MVVVEVKCFYFVCFRNLICYTRQGRNRVSCCSKCLQLVTWMRMRREFQEKDLV